MKPFDYKSFLECSAMTLAMSSIIGLGIAIAAVLGGESLASVDAAMTKLSIPWFVFWYLWCRVSSQVILIAAKSSTSPENGNTAKR